MPFLILIAVGLWFWFGDPKNDAANWFYSNEPAPWETVDAYYYPNLNNLSLFKVKKNLVDLQACRDWVYFMASQNNDSNLNRGDYECGVGKPENKYGLNVYRITVN